MQPTLTQSILEELKLYETNNKNKPTTRTLPAYSIFTLTSHEKDEDLTTMPSLQKFGKLLFLKIRHPDQTGIKDEGLIIKLKEEFL